MLLSSPMMFVELLANEGKSLKDILSLILHSWNDILKDLRYENYRNDVYYAEQSVSSKWSQSNVTKFTLILTHC